MVIKAKSDVSGINHLISILTGLGFFAKQFYISRSGSLQIADIILMVATILSAITYGIRLKKKDSPFAIFIIFSIIINTLYYLYYDDNRFVLSILFMLYNGLVVLFLFRPMLNCDYFLKTLALSCKFVLLSQLAFFISGVGKWAYRGTRYIGTFNDPNQYGFYVLSCFFCIYVISAVRGEKLSIWWLVLPAFEILPSASTGMIMTYVIFNIGYVIGLNKTDDNNANNKEIFVIMLLSIFMVVIAVFYRQIISIIGNANIFGLNRIINRFLRGSTSGGLGKEFLEDRGLMRIVAEPFYFIYGSGEGGWFRFKYISNEGYELHSTVIGLAYYYGVIPFITLVKWVYYNVGNLKSTVVFVYISLFLEALTLINHRQPIFWFLIILASHQKFKNIKKLNMPEVNLYEFDDKRTSEIR